VIDTSGRQRVRRALSLSTATPVSAKDTDGDLWVVKGSTSSDETYRNYSVGLDHETYGECCPCRDHELQRERQSDIPCKHIIRAIIDATRLNCRRGPKIIRH
jgi:hypothetical protein